MTSVLTIAGYDPSSGAGITADLMVFAAHGLFGTSAITALTVQSTTGVRSVHPIAADVLRATLECLQGDLPPAGVKIGMLANAANVAVVCDYLAALREAPGMASVPVVLDPVLRSSSGRELLDAAGEALLRGRLLPLVDWVTPNLDELAALTGRAVRSGADLPGAAKALQQSIPAGPHGLRPGVYAKGGHLDPPDDFVLSPDGEPMWLRGTRVETRATHGTGCALSSALMSVHVIGRSWSEAATAAKNYVSGAIRTAQPIGQGISPINHLWTIDHR